MIRLVQAVQKAIGKSVFLPMPKGSSMESILAIMFHRVSATLYFIYTAWAIVATLTGIPSLIEARGAQWQVIFSLSVLIFSAPSCFGATFWPSFARMELFAGLGFSVLIGIYTLVLAGNALFGLGPWAGVIIISSVAVVPICRVVIVIIFLIRQADERKAKVRLSSLGGDLFPMPKAD